VLSRHTTQLVLAQHDVLLDQLVGSRPLRKCAIADVVAIALDEVADHPAALSSFPGGIVRVRRPYLQPLAFFTFSLKKIMCLALRTRYTTSRKMLHQNKVYCGCREKVDKKHLKQLKEPNI
jgi:hypothetical protein